MTEDATRKSCSYVAALHPGSAEDQVPVPCLTHVSPGVSLLDFGSRRLRAFVVVSAVLLLLLLAAPAWARHHQPPPPPPPPPPTLTLTFNPQMPSLPDNSALGTVVATATAAWSDGSSFTGTLMFGSPYADDGGTFALSCQQCAMAQIIVNPIGLGLMGDGGTTQNITIVATQ
jgi:hypothetical protein